MLVTPAKAARMLRRFVKSASSRYAVGKSLIWFILLFYACLAAIITVGTQGRVAQLTFDSAQAFRNVPYGYMLLIVVMIVVSFPPFIGHGPILHLFGFTYGMWGFFPAAFGTLLASVVVFATLRMMFGKKPRMLTSTNERWRALEAVIRSKGMPLIILIRMSTLVPWAWSNSLFASIASVSLLQFFIATCFVLPKVFIHVFIGAILARLSDTRLKQRIRLLTRFLDSILIIGGILLTFLASSLVYYFVQKEIKRLRDRSPERDEIILEPSKATEETPFSESTV
ncbi:hypothetical protein CY34DRAFT_21282 [Suillus luteus UH-Slu-Lm8-n1]|uniref:Unplaced genomic scaffold CY34scaffold_13, whole genome shotgun sequence n=1 Tax=Suillus luteus UH-Slu-Lm8-n1 TaxID=930992 RepID=A0A0D0ABV4_9AGAM|nr:hypothetical protein CY34DRAFT_21282 [Suillus luteus UH-Slu-Lm8-n1]